MFLPYSPPGWYHLPGIPRVPRASADLPHVVHRDCQFHRCRRRSLGLLSCVSALLIWHHPTHTHSSTLKPLLCHWKTKPPFVALVTNYQASLIIFPLLENCWSGKSFLCAKSPFQIFQGQALNWMLLSFETLNNVLTVKRASASVFFTLATINADNGENGLKWFWGAQSLLQPLLFL